MKPKKTLSAYVLLVGILTLSIVGGALVFLIVASNSKTQLPKEQTDLTKPIEGTLDKTILDNLNKRRTFSMSDLEKQIVTPTPAAASSGASLEQQ